jgi:hypothetical protein
MLSRVVEKMEYGPAQETLAAAEEVQEIVEVASYS